MAHLPFIAVCPAQNAIPDLKYLLGLAKIQAQAGKG
jgi:hypothetical protein